MRNTTYGIQLLIFVFFSSALAKNNKNGVLRKYAYVVHGKIYMKIKRSSKESLWKTK